MIVVLCFPNCSESSSTVTFSFSDIELMIFFSVSVSFVVALLVALLVAFMVALLVAFCSSSRNPLLSNGMVTVIVDVPKS